MPTSSSRPYRLDSSSDIAFFLHLVKHGSITHAARALGLSPAAVSKRLSKLEERLNVRLINRTTRSMSLTGEGRLYLEKGQSVLEQLEMLEQLLSMARGEPTGRLRINAPLNFGRLRLAPVISSFMREYTQIEVDLDLTDHPRDIVKGGYDLAIRLGTQPDSGLHARRLAANSRYLCASPTYLQRHGVPRTPADLAQHQCLVVRRKDAPFGVWTLARDGIEEAVRISSRMICNDGEVALNWALEHHGILMRSGWDIARFVRANQLRIVLPDYQLPSRDLYVVFHDPVHLAPKVRTFIDFVSHALDKLDRIDEAYLRE